MNNVFLLPLVFALAPTAISSEHADASHSPQTGTIRIETVRTDQTAVSRSDRARAQTWGLSETERRRYAEVWAQAMWEDAERILAFQRAYVEAGRRLYPGVPLIDPSRLPKNDDQTAGLQPLDRVLFFTRPDCTSCDVLLARLFTRIDQIAGVDIYLAGIKPGDDKVVRDWAAKHGIAPEWVQGRKVTLNFEAGALAELTEGRGEIPYLMRRRGENLAVLSPTEF